MWGTPGRRGNPPSRGPKKKLSFIFILKAEPVRSKAPRSRNTSVFEDFLGSRHNFLSVFCGPSRSEVVIAKRGQAFSIFSRLPSSETQITEIL